MSHLGIGCDLRKRLPNGYCFREYALRQRSGIYLYMPTYILYICRHTVCIYDREGVFLVGGLY